MSIFAKVASVGSLVTMVLSGLGTAMAAPIVVGTDQNVLNFVDTNTISTTGSVAVTGTDSTLTDVAFDQNGNLFGITFSNLYSINQASGVATLIGGLGGNRFNALTINSSGQAFTAADSIGDLFSVNLGTGLATSIGTIGAGFTSSSGDLEFANGTLFGIDGAGTDNLYSLNPLTGAGALIGSTGLATVFGLAFADDTLFGLSGGSNTLFSIALGTGLATSLGAITGFVGGTVAFGASAVVSPVPVPAALPLFGTGLGLLGYMGWRRKKRRVAEAAAA